jgi:2-keto-4-pentenoate hydratase
LWEAEQSGTLCAPVREWLGDQNIKDAYEVQTINHQRRLQKGFQSVGVKIGLTSKAVQAQLGVDQPDFGVIYAQTQIENGATRSVQGLHQPKIEAEMAFRLKADLNKSNLTESDVLEAIDCVSASLELVGSRVQNWDIRIADTVADNASASHFVLSNESSSVEQVDMVNAGMKLWRNGELVSQGKAAACLGSPLKALLWLAQTFFELGQPLKAGDWVLSGALGPMVTVAPGDRFTAEIEGLGSVGLNFSHE